MRKNEHWCPNRVWGFRNFSRGIIRYIDWIKVDGPIVVNWYYNIVHKALKQTGKRLGILVSLTNEILNACEGGKLKISESGIYGDLVMIDGRAVLVGNSLSEIMEKLEVLRN